MSVEALITPAIVVTVVLFMWNRINARFDAVNARIDGIARDVAFLAGRQAERDAAG